MVLPKNSKDVKGLREFLTALQTQTCSASGAFSEPLKSVFTELGKKFDTVIGALPTGDVPGDWSLENQLENLFNLLTCASAATSQAILEGTKLREEKEAIASQYASKLTTDIAAKVASGELFTKDAHTAAVTKATEGLVPQATVTQLCSESLTKGIAQGEQNANAKITAADNLRNLIVTRKDALQKASFPLPETAFESVLGGTDEEFTKAKTMVETRREDLKKEGIQLNSADLLSNLWLPEPQYNVFRKTVGGIPALKIVAEPLASPTGAPGAAPTGRILVV